MTAVLCVKNYSLDYITRSRHQRVLEKIGLTIDKGKVLGLVGESGSGKTSLAWALMRYLPNNAKEAREGVITLGNIDLRSASPKVLGSVRGNRMSMVFQDPSTRSIPHLRSVGKSRKSSFVIAV